MPSWIDHLTVFGGVGVTIACSQLFVAALVLPRERRRALRLPFALLLLHVAVVGLRAVMTEEAQIPLRVTGVFLLLSSVARSGYLLLMQVVVVPTLGGNVPKILRDVLQALLFLGAVLFTLRAAGVELSALLTTSALLTAVIGFALQDTLGNLFSGLAIQMQRPFHVGDWIQFDDDERHVGRVVEINWRAVRVITLDHFEMTVPNTTLAKASLHNYSTPHRRVRRHVQVTAPYDRPPERIIPELVEALRGVEGVLWVPQPSVIVEDFTERGVRYDVRYFIDDYDAREAIGGRIRERLWYALQRAGIEIPVPQRSIRMFDLTEERLAHEEEARVEERDRALRSVDFLRALPDAARHQLAEGTRRRLYAPGEPIILEGEIGSELFIIGRGQVQVELDQGRRVVATLGAGQFFGEMSLMTGAQRAASVRSVDETEVLVIDKYALRPVLEAEPELAETISRVLAVRMDELAASDPAAMQDTKESVELETVDLLHRIKSFFSLSGRTVVPERREGKDRPTVAPFDRDDD